MSIVADVSDKCTPAECYVLECFDMVTLPEYLHTRLYFSFDNPHSACYSIFNCMEDILKKLGEFWRTVRDFWKTGKTGVVLFLISLFILIYGKIALDYEITRGWKGHESVQNVLKDISTFIPVGAAVVGMIVGGIDFIMLLSDWFLERREKRIKAAKEEGRKEGREEGREEGYAEGYAAAKAENGDAVEESPDSPSESSDSPPKPSKKS